MKQYLNTWRKYITENITQIPENVLEKYREGNCLLFAETILKLLNNPSAHLSSIIANIDGYSWTIAHVVVYFNGRYIDIDGVQTEKDIKKKIINYYVNNGFEKDQIQIAIKSYNSSEWEEFEYDPEDTTEKHFIDLNKDNKDDNKQTSTPGKIHPEPPEETLKWAKIVLNNANVVINETSI